MSSTIAKEGVQPESVSINGPKRIFLTIRYHGVMSKAQNHLVKAASFSQDALEEGVSVVMVSFYTGPVLFTAIDAALERDQKGVVELILVNNGNPTEVNEALEHRAEKELRLRLISGQGNVGFARGCNIGARQAVGRWLLLLNPDCVLAPGAVPCLLSEATQLGEHWMLGCRVVNPDGSEQRGTRRALLSPLTALVEVFRLDILLPWVFRTHRLNLYDTPLPKETALIPAISGACMMLPAATFSTHKGLDEGYFLHVEDLDLFIRLSGANVPIYFVPNVEATHYPSSSQVNPIFVEWHKTRSFFRYFWLHFRSPLYLIVWGPLSICILARFGLRAIKLFLNAVWEKVFRIRAPNTPPSHSAEN